MKPENNTAKNNDYEEDYLESLLEIRTLQRELEKARLLNVDNLTSATTSETLKYSEVEKLKAQLDLALKNLQELQVEVELGIKNADLAKIIAPSDDLLPNQLRVLQMSRRNRTY